MIEENRPIWFIDRKKWRSKKPSRKYSFSIPANIRSLIWANIILCLHIHILCLYTSMLFPDICLQHLYITCPPFHEGTSWQASNVAGTSLFDVTWTCNAELYENDGMISSKNDGMHSTSSQNNRYSLTTKPHTTYFNEFN